MTLVGMLKNILIESKKDNKMNPTQKSKFLALILRHDPSTIGVKIDSNGWVNVKEFLEKSNSYGVPFTIEELKNIVRNDNKQRYSFNEDGTLIRANQGHSITVDVELKETEPPKLLYHGTVDRFLPSIKENGLKKMSRLHVHLSEDFRTAERVGSRRGTPIILKILAKEMFQDGFKFYLSENNVWLTEEVPSKYII